MHSTSSSYSRSLGWFLRSPTQCWRPPPKRSLKRGVIPVEFGPSARFNQWPYGKPGATLTLRGRGSILNEWLRGLLPTVLASSLGTRMSKENYPLEYISWGADLRHRQACRAEAKGRVPVCCGLQKQQRPQVLQRFQQAEVHRVPMLQTSIFVLITGPIRKPHNYFSTRAGHVKKNLRMHAP